MRIVEVGGVAGGMSCAARARRLDEDAQIVVLEAGEHVSFANCGLPYYVGGEIDDEQRLLVQTPASLRASLNLDVRTRSEVIGLDTDGDADPGGDAGTGGGDAGGGAPNFRPERDARAAAWRARSGANAATSTRPGSSPQGRGAVA